jgi:hypothetical protein
MLEGVASEAGQPTLPLTLTQIKQLTELILSGPEQVFDKTLRREKYAAVNLNTLVKYV